MATCRTRLAGALAPALAVGTMVVSGCGGGTGSPPSRAALTARQPSSSQDPASGPFAWLRPRAAPAGWTVTAITDRASLAYPPGWRAVGGDRGTVSAALLDPGGRYLGYLNLTPRQGAETAAGWASFRVRHNRAEGERNAQLDAQARGLRFRTGRGACVQDAYTTAANVRYEEIACLIDGPRASSVVVGAAPSGSWSRERGTIERAISSTTT